MDTPKIFVIGLHKTGTTSLSMALKQLGYRVMEQEIANPQLDQDMLFDLATQKLNQYDAFRDDYWPMLYQMVDQHIPNSKFILTERPTDQWINSVVRHFGSTENQLREMFYGHASPIGYEAAYRARYEQHNQSVLAYFQDKPDKLLVLRITDGDGWEKLCPFLDKDIPTSDFPNVNKGDTREKHKSHVDSNVQGFDDKLEMLQNTTEAPVFVQVMPVFFVSDLDQSENFYSTQLGFQTLFKYPPFFAVVANNGMTIRLASDDGADPTPTHCEVVVNGVDLLYEQYQNQNVIPDDGHMLTDWMARRFSVIDPDKNRISFMEPQIGV